MSADWKYIHDRIRRATNLATSPVGVRLIKDASELDRLETKRVGSTALCKMALTARYYREDGVISSTASDQRCVWGASNVGLMASPERLINGSLYIPFTRDTEAAANLHHSIEMMGDEGKRYDAVLMAPLDLMPAEPQAIVVYVTSGQALRLILALVYANGRAIETAMTGQCSLCTSIAKAIDGKVSLDVPCIGDRSYGLVTDDELLMVIPAKMTQQLMEGLDGTKTAGSHPYRPNVQWMVSMPGPYMPYPHETR